MAEIGGGSLSDIRSLFCRAVSKLSLRLRVDLVSDVHRDIMKEKVVFKIATNDKSTERALSVGELEVLSEQVHSPATTLAKVMVEALMEDGDG